MADPRIIELEPACCASSQEGRRWGDAGAFERCEEAECAPVRYIREDLHKEREAALLEEIERLKEAGKVLARYLEDMDDQGYHPVPIDAQDRAAAKVFYPLWEGE